MPSDLERLREKLNLLPVCTSRGLHCTEMEIGWARVEMRTPSHLLADRGEVPAALIIGLTDVAASFALHTVVPLSDLHVTIELSTHFSLPAFGDALIAEGTVIHRGRRRAFADAQVFDSGGALCAVASGTWSVIEASPHAFLRQQPNAW